MYTVCTKSSNFSVSFEILPVASYLCSEFSKKEKKYWYIGGYFIVTVNSKGARPNYYWKN